MVVVVVVVVVMVFSCHHVTFYSDDLFAYAFTLVQYDRLLRSILQRQ